MAVSRVGTSARSLSTLSESEEDIASALTKWDSLLLCGRFLVMTRKEHRKGSAGSYIKDAAQLTT